MTAPPSHATIVVTTCGGSRSRLESTVQTALAQDYASFDVVVVDNRPTESGVEAALASAFDGKMVRYVAEPHRGLSHARNLGARSASGEIVAFTDDDVELDPAWLSALVSGFTDPAVICVTGLIVALEVRTHAQHLFEEFGGFSKGLERRVWDPRADNGHDPLFPYAVGAYGSGGNAAFRRNELLALGGFDVRLGTGTPARGGEDLDIFLTCMLRGHRIVYEPRAIVRHAHHERMDELRRQLRNYGVGLGAMLTKQLLSDPTIALALVARLPAGLRHLISPRSAKNASRSARYPRSLALTELVGIAYGPIAYVRSRRSS